MLTSVVSLKVTLSFPFIMDDQLVFCYLLCLPDVEKMISLKGMIIRCSSVIPEIREAIFRCLVCGYYSDPIVVERGNCLLRPFHYSYDACNF